MARTKTSTPPFLFDPIKPSFSGLTGPAQPKVTVASPSVQPNISVAPPTPTPSISVGSPTPTPSISVGSPTPTPSVSVGALPSTPSVSVGQAPSGGSQTVQAGDTLSAIAAQNNISLSQLLALNPQFQANPNLIQPGDVVNFGSQAAQPATATPTPPSQPGTITTPSGVVVNPSTGGVVTPPVPDVTAPTPTPPPAPTPSPTQAAITETESEIEKNLRLTPGEIQTQEEIDRLQTSFTQAFTGEAQRPIPLGFITGRQKAIEQRALGLAQPLQAKAALEQAKRVASLEASRFKLERLDKQETARKAEERGRVVGDRIVRFNPETQQFDTIFKSPEEDAGFTLGEGQIRFDSNGILIAKNIGSAGLSGGFGGAGYVIGENSTVDSWVSLINSGQATLPNVPGEDLKNAVANALTAGGSSETDETKAQILQDKIDNLNSLIDHPGMSKSVGPTGIARFTPFKIDTWNSDVQDFVGKVHQMTSKETLDYLINLKAQGGTLGALNQSELDILKSSATAINDWEIKKDGEPTGKWNIGEKQFKAELKRLRTLTQRALIRAVGTGSGSNVITTPDGLKWKRLPDGSFDQVFSNGGGGTPTATGMRTDRHNNPTAFTVDIAKQAGLKEGVDFTVGDAFPNNPNLRTARLMGDPIAITIKVINKIGFFTGSGAPRWSHTAMDKSEWNKLNNSQKASVISRMYQREGGSALSSLFQAYA